MMFRNHPAVKGKNDRFEVDPRFLKVDPEFNVRDLDHPSERDDLDRLKAQIRADGVQQPLEARLEGEDLYVESGHRRRKVVLELIAEGHAIDTVPVIAQDRKISRGERIARLVTMNEGKPLSQMERAKVLKMLLEEGWERDKIARDVFGLQTTQMLDHYERLLEAPEPIQDLVRADEIAPAVAVGLIREQGPEQATETLAKAGEVARSEGRKRITPKTINKVRPKPESRPRKPAAAAPPEPEKPPVVRNLAKIDGGISQLYDIAASGFPADRAAGLYMARRSDDVEIVIEWLGQFLGHLRAKEDGDRPPEVEPDHSAQAASDAVPVV